MTLRVVVADDHPLVLNGLKTVIGELTPGVEVLEAADYGGLISILAEEADLDLIVADLNMPGGDGWTGLSTVCQMAEDIPVLVLTGHDDSATVRRAAAAGAKGYMVKSENPERMLEVLRALLDGQQSFPAYVDAVAARKDVRVGSGDFVGLAQVAPEVLDRVAWAMFITDASGRVQYRNRAAEAMLGQADGITLDVSGTLRAREPEQGRRLLQMIEGVASGESLEDSAISLNRRSHGRPYSVVVTAMGPGAGRLACVIISDPDQKMAVSTSLLGRLYELTDAESRIVQGLLSGMRPDEIAKEADVSLNTVRSHMKAVFRKTDTGSQAQLMKLILTDAVWATANNQ